MHMSAFWRGVSDLIAFDVLLNACKGVIESRLLQLVDNTLSLAALSCVRLNRSEFLQLAQVPRDGLVSSANGPAYVARSSALGVLCEMAKYLNP